MAKVTSCDICNKSLINCYRCEACARAVLVDMLARVQKALSAGTCLMFDDALKQELRRGKFETLEEYRAKIDSPKVVLPTADGTSQQTVKIEVSPERGPVIAGTFEVPTEQWSGHRKIRPDGDEGS